MYRLALLLDEELRKVSRMLLDLVGIGEDGLLALSERDVGPGLEGLIGGGDGVVHVLLGGDGDVGVGLRESRVDAMALLGGGGLFTVDGILEVFEDVESHFAGFSCATVKTGRAAASPPGGGTSRLYSQHSPPEGDVTSRDKGAWAGELTPRPTRSSRLERMQQ